MKASLILESIGHANVQRERLFMAKCDAVIPGLGAFVIGKSSTRGWVALIRGPGGKFRLDRQFLKPKIDYKNSNGAGTRGVQKCYLLESGNVYEVSDPKSWKCDEKYFVVVLECGTIRRFKTYEEAVGQERP